MGCSKCITSNLKINTPNELISAINSIQKLIDMGNVMDIGSDQYGYDFKMLIDGNWGDIVSHYFECNTCHQLFHLFAETYHGSGGGIELISSVE